jgi:ATP-binding cassette subfamily F protein 3
VVIVRNVSRSVLAGQRIGILGANGQGKSTVVKTIARALAVQGGEITEGKGLNIGYFAQQELDVLRPQDNPLEHMIGLVRQLTALGKLQGQATREQDLRSFLGTFNFNGDMVKQTVGSMSGGEKARLVLCMIVWQRPNLLLLDEPTNHLDLATREALGMALNEFEGTVMLVSHDRALLRSVCDEFWMVSRGGVAPFDGDLDDYQRYLLDEAKRQREAARDEAKVASKSEVRAAAVQTTPASANAGAVAAQSASSAKGSTHAAGPVGAPSSEQRKRWQKELQSVEARIHVLQEEAATIETRLAALPNPADIAELAKRLHTLNSEREQLEERWLELSVVAEDATAR